MRALTLGLSLSVLAGVAGFLGCDKAENPLAPSGTILTVTVVPSQIALTGQGATLTIIGVRPDGNAIHPGTQITVTTNLGVVRPAEASCTSTAVVAILEADNRGQARATLCGDGRAGDATVRASLTNATGGDMGTGAAEVTVTIGATDASKPTVIISANPSIVPVQDCTRISLLGRNSDGSPVAAGQRIRLTADLGVLICPAVTNCPENPPASSCSSVLTNANGEAQVTFRAGDRGGMAEVSAILGTSDEAVVPITIRARLAQLSVTASPPTIPRDPNGVDITVTAFAADPLGAPIASLLVTFSACRECEPNTPGRAIGSFDPITVSTGAQGQAETTLTVSSVDLPAGTTEFLVKATASSEGETITASTTVSVQ